MANGRRVAGARRGLRDTGRWRGRSRRRGCRSSAPSHAPRGRDHRGADPRRGTLVWSGAADGPTALGAGAGDPPTPGARRPGPVGLGVRVGAARRGGEPPRLPLPGATAQVRATREPAHQSCGRRGVAKGVCRTRLRLGAAREDAARQRAAVAERSWRAVPEREPATDRAAGLSDARSGRHPVPRFGDHARPGQRAAAGDGPYRGRRA